jgi:Complex 1 protein (LYR family)
MHSLVLYVTSHLTRSKHKTKKTHEKNRRFESFFFLDFNFFQSLEHAICTGVMGKLCIYLNNMLRLYRRFLKVSNNSFGQSIDQSHNSSFISPALCGSDFLLSQNKLAQQLPSHNHREFVRASVRRKFRDAANETDPQQIQFLNNVASVQLETLQVQVEHLSALADNEQQKFIPLKREPRQRQRVRRRKSKPN